MNFADNERCMRTVGDNTEYIPKCTM